MSTPKSESKDHNASCIIAAGTVIKGNIKTTEDLRVDGSINGEIKTTGRVIIGTNGSVEGILDTREIIASGFLKSSDIQTQSLTLKSTGRIEGELKTTNLIIESGGVFNGMSSMDKTK